MIELERMLSEEPSPKRRKKYNERDEKISQVFRIKLFKRISYNIKYIFYNNNSNTMYEYIYTFLVYNEVIFILF